ncbi:phospholipase [Aquihabitans sp. G128]|uniref:phospholipase n=1 Tax=Aquihabitans sp. G128 TaxID=2849779 RepID=UPI0020B45B74|nr:phospholipase [Aquihabitans sp. G128]
MLTAAPAGAITTSQKQAILYQELGSASVFNTMYANRTKAPNNEFDWSTDLCSWSPDNPFGFNFSSACRRHDFNYRNFKATGIFTANKPKIDTAFYNDMKAICAPYGVVKRTACNGLASTYYNAVKKLGS